jgi:hypothetical protein
MKNQVSLNVDGFIGSAHLLISYTKYKYLPIALAFKHEVVKRV